MSRKTTKAAIDLINIFDAFLKHYDERICCAERENHPVSEKIELLSRVRAQQSMVETFLHAQGCYHGFCYVDSNGMPIEWVEKYDMISLHPEYRDYRVAFSIKK